MQKYVKRGGGGDLIRRKIFSFIFFLNISKRHWHLSMFFNFLFFYLTVNLFQVEFNDDLRRQSVDSPISLPERFSSSHQGGRTSSSESDLEERPEVITREAAQESALDGRNFRLLSPIRSDPSSCSASLPRLSPASDSGGSGIDGRLTKRRRGRPSKKVAHRDGPAEDPTSRGGPHEDPSPPPPPPPIPILKLRIPKALFQNAGETAGVSRSAYRRVGVRRGERRAQRPPGVQNRLAQQLRALQPANCKVDVQKFRFKVGLCIVNDNVADP
jgi:hypothetical protein